MWRIFHGIRHKSLHTSLHSVGTGTALGNLDTSIGNREA